MKPIIYGAIVGAIFGVIISVAGFFRSYSEAGRSYDEHGYATIGLILICGVLGAALGLAAGLGAFVKKKFEGESE